MPPARNGGFSFVGMVVGVMTLLKLKDKYDQCESLYFLKKCETKGINGHRQANSV